MRAARPGLWPRDREHVETGGRWPATYVNPVVNLAVTTTSLCVVTAFADATGRTGFGVEPVP